MSLCLNPDCLAFNSKEDSHCGQCGSNLLLRERYRAFIRVLNDVAISFSVIR